MLNMPENKVCEQYVDMPEAEEGRLYCNDPATELRTGERDSWGVEYLYFCAPCVKEHDAEVRAYNEAQRTGACARCKKDVTDRVSFQCDDEQEWEALLTCRECRIRIRKQEEEDFIAEWDREYSRFGEDTYWD